MRPLGAKAPDFSLPDGHGKIHSLAQLRGPDGLVLAFLCNHCPFVDHLAIDIGIFAEECKSQDVRFAGINANDVLRYQMEPWQRAFVVFSLNQFRHLLIFHEDMVKI